MKEESQTLKILYPEQIIRSIAIEYAPDGIKVVVTLEEKTLCYEFPHEADVLFSADPFSDVF